MNEHTVCIPVFCINLYLTAGTSLFAKQMLVWKAVSKLTVVSLGQTEALIALSVASVVFGL